MKAVEEETALAFKGGRKCEIENGLGTGVDGVDGSDPRLMDHGRVHIGRGMERVDGDAAALERSGEVDREHDLRELALTIGAVAAVIPGDHEIVECDRLLAER